jgi:glycosyltransferase involved in cell wall biosynthesis
MKILCVISSLQSGGAERVMTWLSGGLSARAHRVTLSSFEDGSQPPFYGVRPGVDLRYLDLLRASRTRWAALEANAHRLRRLRELYRDTDPDVVVSFVDRTNVLALAAALGSGRGVVVSERVDPRRIDGGRALSWSRTALYPWCQRLVLQGDDLRPFFGRALQDRITVIPNPVIPPPAGGTSAPPPGRKRLLAVGRLTHQKGFDLLIEAFARVAPRFSEWDLVILGEGPDKAQLELQVQRSGLGARVDLAGRHADPFPFYRGAAAFALSSRFEGFPNVLVEAMSLGLPVLATACTGAVSSIVEDGRAGLLVEPDSVEALAAGLATLLGDDAARSRLAQAARGVVERYDPERILDQWESTLAEARCRAPGPPLRPSTPRHTSKGARR